MSTGRFLQHHSADEILFGNTFDKPLKLPWGSGAALKFMQYVQHSRCIGRVIDLLFSYIDPTLEHDLGSHTKPWVSVIATSAIFDFSCNMTGALPLDLNDASFLAYAPP